MAPPPSFKPAKHLKDVQVLIVDDDRRIANLVRSVLQGLGFQTVHTVFSGEEAHIFLNEYPVDLVICDWWMEAMNGVELISRLRRNASSPNRHVPVIMLSGNTEKPQIEEARDSGITEYVMKPFTAKSLCSRIIAVINQPRSFVICPKFKGHNRRRRKLEVVKDRRQKPY